VIAAELRETIRMRPIRKSKMAGITTVLKIPKSKEELMEELLSDSISCLETTGIPQRVINTLEENGVKSMRDLTNCCSHPLEECEKSWECHKTCPCFESFPDGSNERRRWSPRVYLREIPGFADITVERILAAVRKKISSIYGK
jgi:hypothetical protein